jgi:hypothetical protein
MKKKNIIDTRFNIIMSAFLLIVFTSNLAYSGSLDLPARTWGISFGNSSEFTGMRFNFRDSQVRCIRGVNVTLWQPRKDNQGAVIKGFSLGFEPGGDFLYGIQIGLLGVSAEHRLSGMNIGLLGIGSGENMAGVNIGGLGTGASKNMVGINVSILGVGAGDKIIGINLCGVGIGAGHSLAGLSICGVAVGSTAVSGLSIAGLTISGKNLQGIQVALGMVRVKKDGCMTGLSASPFNYFKGTQIGITIGLVNYTETLKGIQFGLVNIVHDKSKFFKVLPIFNARF